MEYLLDRFHDLENGDCMEPQSKIIRDWKVLNYFTIRIIEMVERTLREKCYAFKCTVKDAMYNNRTSLKK